MVVAIIALLIAILLPSLTEARNVAKVTVCASNQRQVRIATEFYMQAYRQTEPWIFGNGTADYGWEGQEEAFPNKLGNPAIALIGLRSDQLEPGKPTAQAKPGGFLSEKDHYLFFCPLSEYDRDKQYTPNPPDAGDPALGKYWGSYTWFWKHQTMDEDRFDQGGGKLHSNQILFVGEQSRDKLVMSDYQSLTYDHYNALMIDGSVQLITKDFSEFRRWLWGPGGTAY